MDIIGELIGAILLGIAELVAEVLMEAAFAELAGLLARLVRRFRVSVRRGNPVVATVVFTFVGVALGFLSAFIFPHPLVRPSRFHGISLLISPVLTGLVMALIGRAWRRRGRTPVRIESFGYGFTFALAMALVRFWLVR
jgi:LytS/YehU family sensor histidine kinase